LLTQAAAKADAGSCEGLRSTLERAMQQPAFFDAPQGAFFQLQITQILRIGE
jgi:hypothetical protein